MTKSKKRIIIIGVIVAAVLLVIVVGCLIYLYHYGKEVEISDDEYKKMLSNIGIESLESVIDDSVIGSAYRCRIPLKAYSDKKTDLMITYEEMSELCGKRKFYEYKCYYALGKDEAQAETSLEEYKKYLLEQGFEYVRADGFLRNGAYIKGSYMVGISGVYHIESGWYTLYIYYY